ncbi:MAG: preprotein translocase subunit SecG [Marinagarivorans sp.]|nr:preprotein translocase subunit SecG [Marinagarivorans sp.]
MVNFLLVVHVLLALGIIGLIMLQQGKGAEMGASFGSGSSQTIFGAAGTGNFFSHMTGILVGIFFVTSIALAVVAKQASVIGDDFIQSAEQVETSEFDNVDAAKAKAENATSEFHADAATVLDEDAKTAADKAKVIIDNIKDEAQKAE